MNSTIRRVGVATATAGLGLMLAFGTSGVAFADGPTSQRTIQQIMGNPWVVVDQNSMDYRVGAVQCYLRHFGYLDFCDVDGFGGWVYDTSTQAAVKAYQEDNNLPVTGVVDAETWNELMDDVVLVQAGDSRKSIVQGVQLSLHALIAPELVVDGTFGPKTTAAVKEFQTDKGIGVDGKVGPLTFRAMYDERAES